MSANPNQIPANNIIAFPGGALEGAGSQSILNIAQKIGEEFLTTFSQPLSASMTMPDLTRDDIDLRVAASEARTDTKIARLEGKLDTITATLVGKLDGINERMAADHEYNRSTRWVIVGLAFALAALMVGLATYGDAMFGRGMDVRDVVQAAIKELAQQQQQQQSKPPAPNGK